MTDKQWKQAEERLGARIIRAYKSFENNELRIIVKLPNDKHETRYVVHFHGDEIELEHRP